MHYDAPFRLEADMARFLTAHLASAFDLQVGQRARVLQEQPIGGVIPDVLIGIWSGELPRCERLNHVSREILAWLSKEKTAYNQDQLRQGLFLSHRAANSAVSTLERIGAVNKRESGELELSPAFDVSDAVRLIAIEMKLRRWREALSQALQYRKFADESYVVLDGGQVSIEAQIRSAFIENGIGLFVHSQGALKIEVSALPLAPRPSSDRMFALGKLASGPYCLA